MGGSAVPAFAEEPVQEITPDEPDPPPPPPPRPTTPAVPAPAPTPAPKPAKQPYTMDDLTVPKSFLRFGINFFGDTSLIATTPAKPHSTFAVGTLGLRMLGELGPSLDALAELGFETADGVPVADVEQIAIRWRRGPGQLQVGRFHTDLGYWNTAYHHGLWLQLPIERPHILRFEDDGGLLPVHWVGIEYGLSGSVGDGKATFVTAIGNGRGDIIDDVRISSETNEPKSVLAKARYKARSVEVGISAIYDVIAPASAAIRPALPDRKIDELIANAYLVVRGDGPVVIADGYVIQHRANATTTTFGGYALIGYAVTSWLTPYAAVDFVDGADDDPYFVPDPTVAVAFDVVEGIAGVRFDTSTWSALKLELQYQKLRNASDPDYTAFANWSFGL